MIFGATTDALTFVENLAETIMFASDHIKGLSMSSIDFTHLSDAYKESRQFMSDDLRFCGIPVTADFTLDPGVVAVHYTETTHYKNVL